MVTMLPESGAKMRPAIVSAVKREFHGHSRHLAHDKPEQFAKSQWHGRGSALAVWSFLVYRWLLALFLSSAIVISFVDIRTLGWSDASVRRAKWPIYMTNWALLFLTVQSILAAALATRHHLLLTQPDTTMTPLHKLYWVLNNLANVLAPAITIGYWATVYNPEKSHVDFLNVASHIVNSAVVLVDMCVAGHPVRLLHAYHGALAAIVYSAFSGLYYLAGGTNREYSTSIYPLLNWSKPHLAVAASLGAAVMLIIIHILFWVFYLLRRQVALNVVGRRRRAQPSTQGGGEVVVTSGVV